MERSANGERAWVLSSPADEGAEELDVAPDVLGQQPSVLIHLRRVEEGAQQESLGDQREAVTTLEEIERTAQRVLGGANPTTKSIERSLQEARSFLRAREAPGS